MNTDDFSQLVELVFTSSGWRRQATNQEAQTSEFDLLSTGERVLVLWLATATQGVLNAFLAQYGASTYDRLILVHLAGAVQANHLRVTGIGPEHLARAVVDTGLLSWVLSRLS